MFLILKIIKNEGESRSLEAVAEFNKYKRISSIFKRTIIALILITEIIDFIDNLYYYKYHEPKTPMRKDEEKWSNRIWILIQVFISCVLTANVAIIDTPNMFNILSEYLDFAAIKRFGARFNALAMMVILLWIPMILQWFDILGLLDHTLKSN